MSERGFVLVLEMFHDACQWVRTSERNGEKMKLGCSLIGTLGVPNWRKPDDVTAEQVKQSSTISPPHSYEAVAATTRRVIRKDAKINNILLLYNIV